MQGPFSISCILESTQEEFRWCFTGIYGPHTNLEREVMWHEITGARGLWEGHWVLGGISTFADLKGKDSIAQGDPGL